ncbi:MAG TPA: hypothetical protein VGE72_14720 [Azospirillum sp.]
MPGGVLRGVMLLVLLVTAPAEARSADCWLLDADALARARAEGQCRDAFAVNPKGPTVAPPPPPSKTVAPPKAPRRAPARKAPHGTRVADTDFAASLRRDLNAVGQLVTGIFSGKPQRPARKSSRTKAAGPPPPAPHHR